MIKRIAREVPLFESLGIFTEAPKKKRKPRVISVRPIKKDYTDMVDPEESFDIDDDIDDLGDDLSEYDDLEIDLDDDILEDLGEDIPDFEIQDDDTSVPEETEVIDTTGHETGEDLGGDEDIDNQEEIDGDETKTQEVEPEENQDPIVDETVPQEGNGEVIDATGGENPESDSDLGAEVDIVPIDGTDPNQQVPDPNNTTPQDQISNESITKDDVRKYELFKRFMNLYKSIQYFIDKLENGVSDSERFEAVSRRVLLKFKSLEDLTKDYMLLKFQSDSFLQNSFFYEKIKASSLLLLELLNLNKINKEDK